LDLNNEKFEVINEYTIESLIVVGIMNSSSIMVYSRAKGISVINDLSNLTSDLTFKNISLPADAYIAIDPASSNIIYFYSDIAQFDVGTCVLPSYDVDG
jgi:hypothetical protein